MSAQDTDALLRADIRRLGSQLGDALIRQHGPELLELVERVRSLTKEGRSSGGEFDELFLDGLVETIERLAQRAQQLVITHAALAELLGAGGQPLGMTLGESLVVRGFLQFFQLARSQVSLPIGTIDSRNPPASSARFLRHIPHRHGPG